MRPGSRRSRPPDELRARYGEVGRWYQQHRDKIEHGKPPTAAATVRYNWNDGEPVITDGPFLEGKAAIGGYIAIDVADLDEALHLARSWPGKGSVEIRPVVVSR